MPSYSSMKCGDCKHYHKNPPRPDGIIAPTGACRLTLQLLVLPVPISAMQAQQQVQATYPIVPAEFPACSHYAE